MEKGKVRIMEKENELRTWIVIDRDGDRHEVIAHYIAQPTTGGYTNFIIDGEANMGIMHTFHSPRSITLKEPPKLSGPPENYPVTISAPPRGVKGFRVLAWAEKTRYEGHYPGGVVLVHRPNVYPYPYVTWEAYTMDGGETWEASTGHYLADIEKGWLDFTTRVTDLAEK